MLWSYASNQIFPDNVWMHYDTYKTHTHIHTHICKPTAKTQSAAMRLDEVFGLSGSDCWISTSGLVYSLLSHTTLSDQSVCNLREQITNKKLCFPQIYFWHSTLGYGFCTVWFVLLLYKIRSSQYKWNYKYPTEEIPNSWWLQQTSNQLWEACSGGRLLCISTFFIGFSNGYMIICGQNKEYTVGILFVQFTCKSFFTLVYIHSYQHLWVFIYI